MIEVYTCTLNIAILLKVQSAFAQLLTKKNGFSKQIHVTRFRVKVFCDISSYSLKSGKNWTAKLKYSKKVRSHYFECSQLFWSN